MPCYGDGDPVNSSIGPGAAIASPPMRAVGGPHLFSAAVCAAERPMAELIFLLLVFMLGFACGYGVRAWISRRRRRRYRQRQSPEFFSE